MFDISCFFKLKQRSSIFCTDLKQFLYYFHILNTNFILKYFYSNIFSLLFYPSFYKWQLYHCFTLFKKYVVYTVYADVLYTVEQ